MLNLCFRILWEYDRGKPYYAQHKHSSKMLDICMLGFCKIVLYNLYSDSSEKNLVCSIVLGHVAHNKLYNCSTPVANILHRCHGGEIY